MRKLCKLQIICRKLIPTNIIELIFHGLQFLSENGSFNGILVCSESRRFPIICSSHAFSLQFVPDHESLLSPDFSEIGNYKIEEILLREQGFCYFVQILYIKLFGSQ